MKKVFVFGDSIPFGRGLDNIYNRPNLLYDSLLKQDISTFLFNLSIPGNTTQDLLHRLEAGIKARVIDDDNEVKVALLSIGVNDTKGVGSYLNVQISKKVFSQNLMSIIFILKKYGIKPYFISILPVDEDKVKILSQKENIFFSNSVIKKYNQIIKKIGEIEGIKVISVNKLDKDSYVSDGIHLSNIGHQQIFEAIKYNIHIPAFDSRKYLQQLYKIPLNRIIELRKNLKYPYWVTENELFLGSFHTSKFESIFGGICFRKDVEFGKNKISLHGLYQGVIPIVLASKYKVPAIIYLPTREEEILNPSKAVEFVQLSDTYKKVLSQIASKYQVKIQFIDTKENSIHKLFKKYSDILNDVDINYSTMYSFWADREKKYDTKRREIIRYQLVMSSMLVLKEIFGVTSVLSVMDFEQLEFNKWLWQLAGKGKNFNYLGFLPWPSINFNGTIFNTKLNENLFIKWPENHFSGLSDLKEIDFRSRMIYKIVDNLLTLSL